jgi:O-antigen ligase
VIRFAEQPVKRNFMACLFLVPLIAVGMVANDRRLVWVELLIPLIAYWLVSRRSQIKRYFVRGLLLALPLIVGYVGAGWNSTSGVFAPVRTLRSVGDSDVDASTMYRDLENFNLLMTLRLNMVTGAGFGQPFAEVVTLPNISFFQEYRYLPHNSVLGLWAFAGPFGFTGLTAAMVVAIYLAARAYQYVKQPDERTAAVMVMAVILIYMVHCWGDIGFTERRSMYLVGPVLAIAAQLAVSSGAWRMRTIRPRSSAAHS